jgi:putative oxidoreductase
MRLGRLVLRATVGGFFVGHGTQKLFGWFGGEGLGSTAETFEKLGLRPPRVHALAAGTAEAGGGAMLLAGLATPVAASALTATMLTAIRTVHFKNGPWTTKGGYEYNVVLIAAVLALADAGPGKLSLDAALGRERRGIGWALGALAGGALAAVGVKLASDAASAPSTPPPPARPASRETTSATAPAPAATS